MIEFANVTKHYPDHTALSDVTFSIPAGEMVFLTGHSGAGKSTILKLAMGIELPSEGSVHIQRQNILNLPSRKLPYLRKRIGMIHQNPQLLPDQTVFQNVALPLIVHGYHHHEIKRRVAAALDKVALSSKEKLRPAALSCGEQQRVGIARAIINKPDILLADEPTGNLDPELSLDILRLFEAFNNVGVTVLIATHDLSLIAQMPHRMLILQKGTIVKKDHKDGA
jgi:cell division transport system ATP-binding protein